MVKQKVPDVYALCQLCLITHLNNDVPLLSTHVLSAHVGFMGLLEAHR